MSRPRTLPEATPATAVADPWEDWNATEPAADENPVVDGAELYVALKQPRSPQPAEAPPRQAQPTEPEPDASLAAQLAATPAPAVGVIVGEAAVVTVALQAFAGTGPYAARDGRDDTRAAVLTLDREPNGRYVATIERPGQRYTRPEAFAPPLGAGSEAATITWLSSVTAGVRHAARVPLLVAVSGACGLELDALEPVAIEAGAIFALLEHRPGVVQPTWTPRLLEPKPEPPAPAVKPAAQRRPAPKRAPVANPKLAWLGDVAELVRDRPEWIAGPHGERVSVAYGQRDAQGREYVALNATMERDGRLWPFAVEIAPGVEVDLTECRVYVSSEQIG